MWRKLIVVLCILLLALPLSLKAQRACTDGDNDQDGICNGDDACPNDRSNSCRNDGDGDGVIDSQDQCPNERGVSSNSGCPAPDRDGDGTDDSQDRCPDVGGPSWNGGCPEGETPPNETGGDGDGDGTPDSRDQCPNQAGLAAYQGCLPPIPNDGECVAATNSNQRANIRELPSLTAPILSQLDVEEYIPIIEKIDTPDSPFYLSAEGWISGLVLRFAGDCDDVENPEPDANCEDDTREECRPAEISEAAPECGAVFGDIVVAEAGVVTVFDTEGEDSSFIPFGTAFTGGISVATGDVNGDGVPDIITGAGAGAAGGHVKVFDGTTGAELRSFFAFPTGFLGGVNVAAGDVNGDGRDDIIVGAGAGSAGGHVKVFDGNTGAEIRSFFAYDTGFTGGVRVAAGDVNGDGRDDIITSPASAAGPHVKVFDGSTGAVLLSFFAFSPSFTGGVNVAVGDLNGDCIDDIAVGAGPGAGPHVKVFNGVNMSELASFYAYTPDYTGGVAVAIADRNGDGRPDLVTAAQTTAGAHVKVFDGISFGLLASFMS